MKLQKQAQCVRFATGQLLGIFRAKKQCFLKLNGIAWITYGAHTGMASGEALLAAFEAFALGGENRMCQQLCPRCLRHRGHPLSSIIAA